MKELITFILIFFVIWFLLDQDGCRDAAKDLYRDIRHERIVDKVDQWAGVPRDAGVRDAR